MTATGGLARYRVLSKLGSGGMATVDLAEDTLLGRRVALKRMSGEADLAGLTRLRREALVGASFSHSNLVSVYDVLNTDDGHLVIVMEYVEGETLRSVLTRRGRLPAAEALPLLGGVAAGLDAINDRGIVHRDVKPSNILLGAGGAVKLADLGIASAPDRTRITTSGAVLGSLSYMAPEQLSDAPATRAIDVYALAAVSFEVLSGVKARREANPVALAHAISTQGPPSIRMVWPDAPPGLDELLQRAMTRDPRQRPRSAGELVARLRAALEPEDTARVQAPPVHPPPAVVPARRPAAMPPRRAAAVPPRRTAAVPPRRPAAVPPRRAAAVPPRGPAAIPLRAPGTVPAPSRRRRQPRPGVVAAAVVGLAAVAAAVVVLLSSGGSPAHPPAKTASTGRSHRGKRPAASGSSSRTTATSRSSESTTASTAAAGAAGTPSAGAAGTASTGAAAGTASTSATGTASTSATGAAPTGATPAAAGDPVSAVKTFYTLAAAHRYADAWKLADPAMQAQVGGYRAFQSGQAGDRSITFTSARTVSQSSSRARVAITTTSVRTNGTQHCAGTVDLVSVGGSGRWQLHQIGINCK